MDHLSFVASGGAGINVLASGAVPAGLLSLAVGTDDAHLVRVRKERGLPVYRSTPEEIRGWEHVEPAVASHFVSLLPAPIREVFTRKVAIHCAGLGGATGTAVATALTRIRAGLSKPTIHLAILPFGVERQRGDRARAAANALEADSTVVLFANDILARAAPDRTFHESMHIANALILEVARGLVALPEATLAMLAKGRGRFAPVIGSGSEFTPRTLADFGAEGANAGHLIAPPRALWLPSLEQKLGESGVEATRHESAGIGEDHWLALLRPL